MALGREETEVDRVVTCLGIQVSYADLSASGTGRILVLQEMSSTALGLEGTSHEVNLMEC
jgi:hypothetical protein